jgi:hypothetical protein
MAKNDNSNGSGTIYDFNPNNLPPEYLRAIGLVTSVSSQTESILKDFIGALLRIDNIQTLALCTHMNIPLKNDIIRTLAELEAPTVNEIDKIDDLLDAVKDALEKRNVIVHNAFMIHPDTKEIFSHRLKARGSFQLELKPVSAKEIEEDAALIYKAGMDIMNFMISRKLSPSLRGRPLRESPNRSKKARASRHENF